MKLAATMGLALVASAPLTSIAPQVTGDSGSPDQEPAAEKLKEVDAATRVLADKLLAQVTKRLKDVSITRANYVQERTSPLLIEPLVSKGVLYQRTLPACLVFRVKTPHGAHIRVDADTYQVYRPDEGTAERFLFEGSHAGQALLDAFRPEAEALFGAFALVDYGESPKEVKLTLRPREKKARKHVDNVILRVDPKRFIPVGVSYVDRDGYVVDLALSKIDLDPKLDNTEELFSPELPEGVQVLVHRIESD